MAGSRIGWLGTFTAAWLILGGCPAEPPAGELGPDGTPIDNPDNPGGGGGDPNNTSPSAALSISPTSGVGPDQELALDASGSSDPDGDALEYEWSQVAGPQVSMDTANLQVATVRTPQVVDTSELRFRVIVRDGRGGEAQAEAGVVVEVASQFAGNAQSAAPYRDALTSDEAYHLLRRAAFGATPQQVQQAVERGLGATVDDLLAERVTPTELQLLADEYEDNIPRRWMVHLMEGPSPLRERLAMFWHDRFASSRRVLEGRDRDLAILHMRMLRANALGNYRQFLEALTLDPQMLIWLDGANSPKESPNENYAREFWELFTLGRDALYSEDDIREGARAFTGIILLRDGQEDARPVYDLLHHDETMKAVFPGRAQPANYNFESIIDLTLAQPEAARYVARNLFVFFIHDNPSDAVVAELAQFFVDNNFEIRPLVRRILTAQAMFSPEARGSQFSTPVEHVVGVARTLDMHMHSEDSQGYILDRLTDELAGAGQELLNPPGVQGWDEDGWLQDQWVLNRVRALGWTMEYGPDRTEDLPYHLLPSVDVWSEREASDDIVDAIAAVFHLDLTDEEHDVYVEVLDEGGWRAFHLQDEQNRRRNVFEMIRLMAMDERVMAR